MSIQVIGAGFGRTGTLSLKAALEMIGFGPCYHMFEVFKHPQHIELWQAKADGKDVAWARLLDDFNASVDWPGAYFWRELMSEYPDAKVLLTVRDSDRWYDSVRETIYQVIDKPPTTDDPVAIAQRDMVISLIMDKTFSGKLGDKAHAIACFEQHNQSVRDSVPAERLLEFEVSQGWQPLCKFLDVAIPEADFPKTNSTEEFKRRRASH